MSHIAGFLWPKRTGRVLLGVALFLMASSLSDVQPGATLAADQPAAAGSAQPSGSGQAAGPQATNSK